MHSYDIIIGPDFSATLDRMAAAQHADILERLIQAAEEASAPRRRRAGHRHAAGIHRGLHRAPVGHQWITWRVDHAHHNIRLLEVADRHAAETSPDISRWENEGGHVPRDFP